MKKVFLLLFFIANFSFADIFYGEEIKSEKKGETEKNLSNLYSACPLPNGLNGLNLATEFEDLTLVGILKMDNKFKALFSDKKDRIYDFSENDLLIEKLIQFEKINLKSVTYINWELTDKCQSPYKITLKL